MKPPKGTRNFGPKDVFIRKNIFEIIEDCFKNYGGRPVDTSLIERSLNVFGDEFNKLVYKIKDDRICDGDTPKPRLRACDGKEKEQLILRYDLTLPIARYVADNGLVQFKGYQIGKVYRKDNPQIAKGRYREFYQCDFDIFGNNICLMIQEIEILNLLNDILEKLLGKHTFTIVINHRELLFWLLHKFGVPKELSATVYSTLDKLYKKDKTEIFDELTIKKIPTDAILNIMKFIDFYESICSGNNEGILKNLLAEGYIDTDHELYFLLYNLQQNQILNIKFDPLLARGMDYYSGLIYEVIYNDRVVMDSSIAAGGRYDNLVEKLGNKSVSAIGLSIGIERIICILDKKVISMESAMFAYVVTLGQVNISDRSRLTLAIRNKGIPCDMSYKKFPTLTQQWSTILSARIVYLIIIGPKEMSNGTISIKDIRRKIQWEIDREKGIEFLASQYLK